MWRGSLGRMRSAAILLVVVLALLALPTSAGAITGTHPWIVTLCKFTDLSSEPVTYTPSYFQQAFAGTGSSSVDLSDWWPEISYNNLSIAGTKVTTQWYSLGMTRFEWAGLNRYDKIRTCAESAVSDGNISNDYSKYFGVIAIFNDDSAARAASTTLAGSLNGSDTTINVASSAGFPTPPFAVTINDGTTNDLEELHVTGVSGTTWTVTRGYENFNPANPHNNGAAISLMDGGDLGESGPNAPVGVTINGKSYTLGFVVLPPQTNIGAASHETGHSFGYPHSRALSTSNQDYQDCYDNMSFDVCHNNSTSLYVFQGDFGAAGVLNDPTPAAAGPGLNAIDLDRQGWMPGGRTYTFSNGSCTQTTRDMAALNYPGASGDMEIRVPASLTIPKENGTSTTTDYYTLELRNKSLWDRGIPQNSVLLHLHGLDGLPYWVDSFGGNAVGHAGALLLADEFVDAAHNTYVAVNRMNAGAHTATVTLGACKINTSLTYTGDTTDDFNDQATLSANLTVSGTSVPIPSQSVDLSVGAQSCSATTDVNGHAQCTLLSINQHPGSYTASASFAGDSAYNGASTSTPFTITQEESQVTYNGALTQDYHDPFTASATLVDPDGGAPIAGKPITFSLGGVDSCGPVLTDSSGNASCTIIPTQPAGTVNIVASFAGDIDYVPSSDTQSFVITREETTTTYIGPTVILGGGSGVTLKAQLLEDGTTAPVPFGQAITLSIGAQSCIGLTDATGVASCTLVFVGGLGPQPLGAVFGGDAYYLPSSDTSKTAIVFAFPSHGAFALGDSTVGAAGPTTSLTWWGSKWSGLNSLTGGSAPSAFKGFAATVETLPTTSPANSCGTSFATRSGNSSKPPDDVPSYMGVIVASGVDKSGSTINGTWGKVVVVKTDTGYDSNPGHPGTGTIVATFCP